MDRTLSQTRSHLNHLLGRVERKGGGSLGSVPDWKTIPFEEFYQNVQHVANAVGDIDWGATDFSEREAAVMRADIEDARLRLHRLCQQTVVIYVFQAGSGGRTVYLRGYGRPVSKLLESFPGSDGPALQALGEFADAGRKRIPALYPGEVIRIGVVTFTDMGGILEDDISRESQLFAPAISLKSGESVKYWVLSGEAICKH